MGEPTQKDVSEGEIETAVDTVVEELDKHELAGPTVTPRSSIEFWDAIMSRAQDRRNALREEHNVEG